MQILPPIASVTSGQILFTPPDGRERAVDIVRLARDGRKIRRIRGRHISMIFQEPMVSLSPLHTIGDQVSEALFLHHRIGHRAGMARTEDMLRQVGFPDPKRALRTYPFQLSGGLRQRAMRFFDWADYGTKLLGVDWILVNFGNRASRLGDQFLVHEILPLTIQGLVR